MLKNNSICYIRFLNFLKYFIYHIKILNLKQIFRIEYLHEYFFLGISYSFSHVMVSKAASTSACDTFRASEYLIDMRAVHISLIRCFANLLCCAAIAALCCAVGVGFGICCGVGFGIAIYNKEYLFRNKY